MEGRATEDDGLAKILTQEGLGRLLERLSKRYLIYGPIARRSDFSFQEIVSAEDLRLDYPTTTIPPKKFFHHRQTLIEYSDGDFHASESPPEKRTLLFGVHSCDLNAILRQDRLFSRQLNDPYYLRLRRNSAVVAVTCTTVSGSCFCASLGTGPTIREGFDLLLTDLGGRFLVEVGSIEGLEMIEGLNLPEATPSDFTEKGRQVEAALEKFEKKMNLDGLIETALGSLNSEVWSMLGEKGGLAGCFPCLSCANCSLVCPTCYCFEVADTPELSLNRGVRVRELDSCQNLGYAAVALGGNFRPDRRDRIRNWMICKFGGGGGGVDSSCVGCGRCIRSCPSRIDITEVARMLRGD
ncbi:MAG: 4Fe-4S dicluster domain-containing protein [Candidatus Bathyarchaeia archaeon]